MSPTRARIFPAVRSPMPRSSVRVLRLAWTAAVISVLAAAMRRSRWRISVMSSAASRRRVRAAPLAGSHGAQQLGGGVGVELPGRPAGEQLGEQHVQPVHRLGAGLDHVVAVLDQGAQRGDRLVDG